MEQRDRGYLGINAAIVTTRTPACSRYRANDGAERSVMSLPREVRESVADVQFPMVASPPAEPKLVLVVHYPARFKLLANGLCVACGARSAVPVCRACELGPDEWVAR